MPRYFGELTTREVGIRLKVSDTTILNWVKKGYLPCRLTGGKHRRFAPSEVDAFEAIMMAPGYRGHKDVLQALLAKQDTVFEQSFEGKRKAIPNTNVTLSKEFSKKVGSTPWPEAWKKPKKKSKPARKPGIKPAGRASK